MQHTRWRPCAWWLAILLAFVLLVAGCGDEPGDRAPDGDTAEDGDDEPDPTDGDGWNPDGDDPVDEPCQDGYGYGYGDCEPDILDCSQDPCIFGECVGVGVSARCLCREGYTGTLCGVCAPGYVVRGLRCVPRDACEDYPCVYGTCRMINARPICNCEIGYTGDHCDRCDAGYRAEELRCVPEGD